MKTIHDFTEDEAMLGKAFVLNMQLQECETLSEAREVLAKFVELMDVMIDNQSKGKLPNESGNI